MSCANWRARFARELRVIRQGHFHDLILQMAGELEELAHSLCAHGGTELVSRDEDEMVKS